MTRVVLVSTSMAHGGAENQVFLLARTMHERGVPVSVVSLLPPMAFEDRFAELGIPFASLDMRRKLPDPRAIGRLARHARTFEADVVHSHMVHANLLARAARPLLPRGTAVIGTAHNTNEGGPIYDRLYRLTDGLSDLLTNVSRDGLEAYVARGAAPRHKIRHVKNGLDADRFTHDPEARRAKREELGLGDAFTWLAIGRLEEQKDYPTMLRAFALTLRSRPDDRLLIVGSGTLCERLEALAQELGIARSATFLGIRTDVPALMSAADAYLMSSAWEGLPMVLLEASAAGLPVVATDVGGNREIVDDGVTGHLAPAGDPDALAETMDRLTGADLGAREAMARTGVETVRREYDLGPVVDTWLGIYREVVGDGRGTRR